MGRRLRIGLTGGVASGKSTAADRFTKHGIPVIAADIASRSVVEPGRPGHSAVIERFGRSVVAASGEIDRRALRALIFSDAASRRALESILHPLIRAEMDRCEQLAAGAYVVLDIPLLIEGAAQSRVDRVLVIDAEETDQEARLMARDGSSAAQARAILQAQSSRAARLEAADDVIENRGSMAELQSAVDLLHRSYLRLALDFRE